MIGNIVRRGNLAKANDQHIFFNSQFKNGCIEYYTKNRLFWEAVRF